MLDAARPVLGLELVRLGDGRERALGEGVGWLCDGYRRGQETVEVFL